MILYKELVNISVVSIIIKINVVVFFLWVVGAFTNPEFMMKNFLVSWKALSEGRVWTLVTSVFSHNMLFHIFINMYVFYGFGIVLENALGGRRFLLFYLGSGIFASLCHALVSAFWISDGTIQALGASGAISGVILLYSLMFPTEKLFLFGILPIPALMASLLVVGLDIWGLIQQTKGSTLPIGHGAHLGGALYGLIYYFIFIYAKR
jgi:rhomboid-like protein